jgi:hypothetical protein
MAFQSRRRWAGHWPVGTDLVAKAPPDGDTMLRKVLRKVPRIVQTASLYAKRPCDPLSELLPVTDLVRSAARFAAQVRNEHARWGALIRKAGIELEQVLAAVWLIGFHPPSSTGDKP